MLTQTSDVIFVVRMMSCDIIVGIRMASLPVFSQMFGYQILVSYIKNNFIVYQAIPAIDLGLNNLATGHN